MGRVGRTFSRGIASGLVFLFSVTLLPACAHAPVARNLDLSGRWKGTSAWANVRRAGRGYKPTGTTQQVWFDMQLVRVDGQITGTGTISMQGLSQVQPFAVDIAGSVQGDRIRLRMTFVRRALRPILFSGTVFGADRIRGSARFDDQGMQATGNPATLTRVGASADNQAP